MLQLQLDLLQRLSWRVRLDYATGEEEDSCTKQYGGRLQGQVKEMFIMYSAL